MVKKMKTRSRAALAVLPSLFFWGACELPKGAEVTGEPRIYLPLGNVLSRQDTYSFAGEFLDPDTINDNVNDAEFYGITDEDKSRRKAWNDIRPEANSDRAGERGDKGVQYICVSVPESPEAALAANAAGLRHHQFRAPFAELANKSIEWFLMTNEEVTSNEAAYEKVEQYIQ